LISGFGENIFEFWFDGLSLDCIAGQHQTPDDVLVACVAAIVHACSSNGLSGLFFCAVIWALVGSLLSL
jgi:hypothetical protein